MNALRTLGIVMVAALWLAGPAAGSEITDEGPRIGTGGKIGYYPINRVLDLADVISAQIGFGFGLHVNAHATRALQFGAGGSAVSRTGLERRGIGVCTESKAELSLLMFSLESVRRTNAFGTYSSYSSGKDRPWLYTTHRDYWGIGVEATAAVINIGFELHPAELPDLLLGLAAVDLLHDDLPKRPLGELSNRLAAPEAKALKTVVVVPSRIIADPSLRIARADGLGVYFSRFGKEAAFGRLGSAMGKRRDRTLADKLNAVLRAKKFDLHRELLERVERVVYLGKGWKVVDVRKALKAYAESGTTKRWGPTRVRRMPDYVALAQHYKADAVLDVRVWEWGVWRNSLKQEAVVRLDVEFKLIAQPANQVLLDVRLNSDVKAKPGAALASFETDDGRLLIQETRDAVGVITAQLADILRAAE